MNSDKNLMKLRLWTAVAAVVIVGSAGSNSALAQVEPVVAPSTWATGIVIDSTGSTPTSAAFDDWNDIPIAVTDPADNPSAFNILDIADVQIANDANLLYIHVTGHKLRTNGLYLAFDTDQDVATGFDIFGLGLVGSELGYSNDFVFDQRTEFNANKNELGQPDAAGSCCTGGPLDLNNGGALMNPAWNVEFEEREWAVPLDGLFSVNAPFDPMFPNPTFNFIVWTDQALTDVTDTISYTLATPPAGTPGDFDLDTDVDGADFLLWQQGFGTTYDAADLADWQANFGLPAAAAAIGTIPEPGSALLAASGAVALGLAIRRKRSNCRR
jgi:hypothetical protein